MGSFTLGFMILKSALRPDPEKEKVSARAKATNKIRWRKNVLFGSSGDDLEAR